jgi:6-phosphogluconate dehydrogenase
MGAKQSVNCGCTSAPSPPMSPPEPTPPPAKQPEGTADVGIVGLGVMGPNLALNLLDRGFTVAVWNLETEVMERFVAENAAKYGAHKILGAPTYEGFAALLKRPRKTLILVVAGKPTDMVIDNLMRVFEAGDVIVDTGNAHFKEQTQRAELVEARGMRFLGMGISGGAEGARKGPAFFPGGTRSVWEDIAPIVEAAAAKASDGRPCVTMCGVKGAGSCVKMFHNAGEYAVLALWGEAVAVMRSWGLSGASAREVLSKWKARGALDSYMLDITIEVVAKEALDGEPGLLLDKVCACMLIALPVGTVHAR